MRITPSVLDVRLGAGDKERRDLKEGIKSFEIHISPVHDVKSSRLQSDEVESIDVVKLAVGDVNERGDVASQVQQCMQFDGRFAFAEGRSGKYGQAEIDGCRVEGVDRFVQFGEKCLRTVKLRAVAISAWASSA